MKQQKHVKSYMGPGGSLNSQDLFINISYNKYQAWHGSKIVVIYERHGPGHMSVPGPNKEQSGRCEDSTVE